jgi:chorismate mutase
MQVETPEKPESLILVEGRLSIERWRKEIDSIDEQLIRLLNERSKCAIELGRIKREIGLPIYSPDRESEVIAHVENINPGPLDSRAVRRLFERIIDESRRIERVTVEKENEEREQVQNAARRRPAKKRKSR